METLKHSEEIDSFFFWVVLTDLVVPINTNKSQSLNKFDFSEKIGKVTLERFPKDVHLWFRTILLLAGLRSHSQSQKNNYRKLYFTKREKEDYFWEH